MGRKVHKSGMGLNSGWAVLPDKALQEWKHWCIKLVATVNVLFGYVSKRIIWGRKTRSTVCYLNLDI